MRTDDGPASARWHRLVTDRRAEMERLSPDRGSFGCSFWDRRAERYAAGVKAADDDRNPFLRWLRRVTDPSSTVLDVGAGTGRFALPLAAGVRYVTAVDPSGGMLGILRRDAERQGVTNLTTVLDT